ncbi:helix-turn-helix transcriptional regulator [Globicatella sp. PHS-GS-PNBC-21-1553]|uniref:helix-turn-helix transcriptional regulator n=1 Tax=Globicatella sp. PHS-GS-PNBC-21-1553 TaxID=2885764 RepID=UPI00298F1F40|nr:helix-turn-helix transcriptional regulator [Globicatella sp. PHS-GS-PNBC-21-1553]WPC08785.1 helix-turn-helix transcriptional regulator [Globicatella sp. PHS-GS-PNBC-21-1553]
MSVVNSKLLKAKIAENGYNIGTLAHEIGVDRDTISNILNGKTKPSYPVMNGIFFTLKLTSDEATNIFFAKNYRNT